MQTESLRKSTKCPSFALGREAKETTWEAVRGEGSRVRGRLDVGGDVPEDLGRVVLYKYEKQKKPRESQRLLHQTKGEGLLLCTRHNPYSLRDNVVPYHHSRTAGDVLLLL